MASKRKPKDTKPSRVQDLSPSEKSAKSVKGGEVATHKSGPTDYNKKNVTTL